MRDVGIDLGRLLTSSHGVRPLISSWLGDDLLAADVPITAGSLTVTGDQNVPETVTLTVPAVHGGRSWVPLEPTDPLAQYGQRLSVSYVLPRTGDADVAVALGWFAIQEWTSDEEAVEVTAHGLLQVVADARLLQPTSPAAGSTLASEFERLMGGLLPFEIDSTLVDRPCPRSFVWDEDRNGALYDIADAWPAQLRVDSDGVVRLRPELPAVPESPTYPAEDLYPSESLFPSDLVAIVEWADGESGTVIGAPRTGTRDEVYNAVIVRAEDMDAPDRPPVQGYAYDTDPASPTYWFGQYGQVPRFAASPLVSTVAQCTAMAAKMLRSALRPTRSRTVAAVPDPRVELDDVARLVFAGESVTGYVSGFTLPLTADGGEASYVVEVP